MLPRHHEPAATSGNGSHALSQIPPSWWITSPSGVVERWGAISLLALASVLGTGCAASQEEEEVPPSSHARPVDGTIASKLYGGSLDMRDDSVVALELNLPEGSKELCSGALIAANVVLTARHCVTPTLTKKVVCSAHGTSENGNHFGDDAPPATINVFRDALAALDAAPDAQGKTIVHDDAKVVCDHDVAFLILDRELPNVKPYVIRTGGIDATEHVNIVGYGKNDVGAALGTRLQKLDVPVLAIGAGTSASKTALGAHEFELGAGSCGGDSGGPAFSAQTGAIIGVVSRGGDCTDDFGHVFVETRGTGDLLSRAFELAGGAPQTEQGPQDPVDPAATPAAPHAGCSAAPSGSAGDAGFAGLVAVAGLAIIRRRRRVSC